MNIIYSKIYVCIMYLSKHLWSKEPINNEMAELNTKLHGQVSRKYIKMIPIKYNNREHGIPEVFEIGIGPGALGTGIGTGGSAGLTSVTGT